MEGQLASIQLYAGSSPARDAKQELSSRGPMEGQRSTKAFHVGSSPAEKAKCPHSETDITYRFER